MTLVRLIGFRGLKAAAAVALTLVMLSPMFTPIGVLLALLVIVLAAVATPLTLSRRDAVSILSVMLACLFLLPENLVLVGPLRSVGQPAQLMGMLGLTLWAAGRIRGTVSARGGHPVRWALF